MGWHGADSVFNHMWVLNVELKSINNSLVRPLGSQMFTDHVLCTSDCIISASVVPANWLGQTVGRLCPQLAHHNSFRTFHHHGSQSSRSEIIIVCQIHQMPNIPQFQLLNRGICCFSLSLQTEYFQTKELLDYITLCLMNISYILYTEWLMGREITITMLVFNCALAVAYY